MSAIESKQHDTARVIRSFLKLNGVAISLAAATSVSLLIKDPDAGTSVRRSATIYGVPTTGEVRYQPIAADVASPGTFLLEWEITFNDGRVQTVPDGEDSDIAYDTWTILKDLG